MNKDRPPDDKHIEGPQDLTKEEPRYQYELLHNFSNANENHSNTDRSEKETFEENFHSNKNALQRFAPFWNVLDKSKSKSNKSRSKSKNRNIQHNKLKVKDVFPLMEKAQSSDKLTGAQENIGQSEDTGFEFIVPNRNEKLLQEFSQYLHPNQHLTGDSDSIKKYFRKEDNGNDLESKFDFKQQNKEDFEIYPNTQFTILYMEDEGSPKPRKKKTGPRYSHRIISEAEAESLTYKNQTKPGSLYNSKPPSPRPSQTSSKNSKQDNVDKKKHDNGEKKSEKKDAHEKKVKPQPKRKSKKSSENKKAPPSPKKSISKKPPPAPSPKDKKKGGCCASCKKKDPDDPKGCCGCCSKNECCNWKCIFCWLVFIIGASFMLCLLLSECGTSKEQYKFKPKEKALLTSAKICGDIFICLVMIFAFILVFFIKCAVKKKCFKYLVIVLLVMHLIIGAGIAGFIYHVKKKGRGKTNSDANCIRKTLIYVIIMLVIGVIPFIVFLLEFRKKPVQVQSQSNANSAAEIMKRKWASVSNNKKPKSTTNGHQKSYAVRTAGYETSSNPQSVFVTTFRL